MSNQNHQKEGILFLFVFLLAVITIVVAVMILSMVAIQKVFFTEGIAPPAIETVLSEDARDAELKREFDIVLKEAGLMTASELGRELEKVPPADDEAMLKFEELINDLIKWLEHWPCLSFEGEFFNACIVLEERKRPIDL